jgi:hypothetical protein
MGHFPEATEYTWGALEAQLGCICGEFGCYRVGWSTYGDRVIEWLETNSWHKLELEVSPKPNGVQRMMYYSNFVV